MKTNTIPIRDIDVRYSDTGKGTPVVLLHGYLESLEIWEPFADVLAQTHRVICPDIPGHGHSGMVGKIHSLELTALYIKELLDKISIERCILIGHSMGGYLALAFAEAFPRTLMGLSLFHSAPFPDTEEKKKNRDREIDLIRQGKKELIINTNIPRAFADDNLAVLKDEVNRAKRIGIENPDEGIIALLEGMKIRPDRTAVITGCKVPFLWILGKKDNYIQYDVIKKKIRMNESGKLHVLENSGHMGFLEEPENAQEIIISFIQECNMAAV